MLVGWTMRARVPAIWAEDEVEGVVEARTGQCRSVLSVYAARGVSILHFG